MNTNVPTSTPGSRPAYEVASELRDLALALMIEAEENAGVVEDDAIDRVDQVAGELAVKLEGLEAIATEEDANATYLTMEIARLSERKVEAAANAARLRGLIEKVLRHSGSERLRSARREFALVGSPPVLEVEDERKIPEEFRVGTLTISGPVGAVASIADLLAELRKEKVVEFTIEPETDFDVSLLLDDVRLVEVADMKTRADKNAIKNFVKKARAAGVDSDVAGTKYVSNRKKLRIK